MKDTVIIHISLVFVMLLIVCCGCSVSLEEEAFDFIAQEQFFQSEADAEAAIFGAYSTLRNGNFSTQAAIGFGDLGTDVARHRWPGNWEDVDRYRYGSGFDRFNSYWIAAYQLIARTNLLIVRVPETTGDRENLDQMLGEAYFLRAFAYFNLVRMFGPVPVMLEPTVSVEEAFGEATQVPRSPVVDVYTQIESDLLLAEELMEYRPGTFDDGRATKMAAIVLLGKAYLQNRDYEKAEVKLRQALNEGQGLYGLYENYYQAFHYQHKNGLEHVFSIQHSSEAGFLGATNQFTAPIVNDIGPNPNDWGRGIWEIQRGFNNIIPDHYRKNVILSPEVIEDVNGNTFTKRSKSIGPFKFWVFNSSCKLDGQLNSCLNFPILRWSDVLLMLAEAINENNGMPTAEAVELVNQVKRRARTEFSAALASDHLGDFVSDGSSSDLLLLDAGTLNYASFREELLFERGMEFVMEGHRRWDLLRFGEDVFFDRASNDPDDRNVLFPIPAEQMDVMGEVWNQNDGY